MLRNKILLIGPQGSGKGTQAELLAASLGVPALSMGQLLREEIASKSDIGREIEGILKAGNLVSDETAAEVLKRRLAQPDAAQGYVLDGYPRNLSQMAAFDFDTPTHVVVLEVPREESLKRLGGRLTCSACGFVASEAMGAKEGEACPKGCSGTLRRRPDDTVEAITRRLDIYESETRPMLASYEAQDLVRRVEGLGTVEEVQQRLKQAVE